MFFFQILQKKYNFFIFSAGDWATDKEEIEADKMQIADKQLIKIENRGEKYRGHPSSGTWEAHERFQKRAQLERVT